MEAITTTYKAPGKVLILGGYAILERPNPGLVLEVDSYFRCVAQWNTDDGAEPIADDAFRVKVTSKQWGSWSGTYVFDMKNGLVPSPESKERNPYVEKTLGWALYCAFKFDEHPQWPKGHILVLSLFADNDFYSQQENLQKSGLKRTVKGLRSLPAFADVVNKSAKTGLGSSAAMISAIVSCVYGHLHHSLNRALAHRVAQICHAAVQGKIGSGFDVCCAFYGSMEYVRYDAKPLNPYLTVLSSPNESFEECGQALIKCIKDPDAWNHEMRPFELPNGMVLICADVAGGSETPSMSKKILDWKARSDGTVWERLLKRNERAIHALKELSSAQNADPSAYDDKLSEFSKRKSKEWAGSDSLSFLFIECHKAFLEVRESMRIMGSLADVPVEPKEQQVLCDMSLDLVPGVLCCGVPGAGGYDAVYALTLGESAAQALEQFWEKFTADGLGNVCALLLRQASSHGAQEDEGFITDNASSKRLKEGE